MRVSATLIVTGSSLEEHLQNLENILMRFQEYGTGVKRAKCLFMSAKMEYLNIAMTVRVAHHGQQGGGY